LATNTNDCTAADGELPDPEPLPDDPLAGDPPVPPVDPELPDEPLGAELPALLPAGGAEAFAGGLFIAEFELFEVVPHEQIRAQRTNVVMVTAASRMVCSPGPKR
jgi:hypothetical protein